MRLYKVPHEDEKDGKLNAWFGTRQEARNFAKGKGIMESHKSDGVVPVEINTDRDTLVRWLNSHCAVDNS